MENEEEYIDDEYEIETFGSIMYDGLSKWVKQYLIDYYEELFYSFSAETYRAIESTIKEDIKLYTDSIPDTLYSYCTIKDSTLWDEAYDKFDAASVVIQWPKNDNWYVRYYSEDGAQSRWMKERLKGEEVPSSAIEAANSIMDNTMAFAYFIKNFVDKAQKVVEQNAIFDLYLLTPNGFKTIVSEIDRTAEILFEDLHDLILTNEEQTN